MKLNKKKQKCNKNEQIQILYLITSFISTKYWLPSTSWGYGVQRHFQQYISYIMAVSFIGEGNIVPEKKTLNKLKIMSFENIIIDFTNINYYKIYKDIDWK